MSGQPAFQDKTTENTVTASLSIQHEGKPTDLITSADTGRSLYREVMNRKEHRAPPMLELLCNDHGEVKVVSIDCRTVTFCWLMPADELDHNHDPELSP